jgi:hypothetical protein
MAWGGIFACLVGSAAMLGACFLLALALPRAVSQPGVAAEAPRADAVTEASSI